MKITELFSRGEFVVAAEVGPPKGCHIEGLVEEAKESLSGITAVNVTDSQSSVMRMGSLATCKIMKDEGSLLRTIIVGIVGGWLGGFLFDFRLHR